MAFEPRDLAASTSTHHSYWTSRNVTSEPETYYSGAPLNRLSWLRSDTAFLRAALYHDSARFLLLHELAPLARSPSELVHVKADEVKAIIGDALFTNAERDFIAAYDSSAPISPTLVFLGLGESNGDAVSISTPAMKDSAIETRRAIGERFSWSSFSGIPYFALDVTRRSTLADAVNTACDKLLERLRDASCSPLQGRTHTGLSHPAAAVYAQARSLIDWNTRNPFCGGCGLRTCSVQAGYKRVCPPTDLAPSSEDPIVTRAPEMSSSRAEKSQNGDTITAAASTKHSNPHEKTEALRKPRPRPDCPTRHGISNLCFPRTDPTIIIAVVSPPEPSQSTPSGPTASHAPGTAPRSSSRHQAILLGRQGRWPAQWYSSLAGFLEPGESIADACRREVLEESGVRLGAVALVASQPWPYPGSLMLGCVGVAESPGPDADTAASSSTGGSAWVGRVCRGWDAELEDARWFAVADVRHALHNNAIELDTAEDRRQPASGEAGPRNAQSSSTSTTSNPSVSEGQPGPWQPGHPGVRIPPSTAIAHQLIEAALELAEKGFDSIPAQQRLT